MAQLVVNDNLRSDVYRFLRHNPLGRPFQTTEVVNFLRERHSSSSLRREVGRNEINAILYELHDRAELVRVSISPPVWLSNPNPRARALVRNVVSSSVSVGSGPVLYSNDPLPPPPPPPATLQNVVTEGRVPDIRSTGRRGFGGSGRDLAENILNVMRELKPEESIHPRILAKRLMLCCKSDVNPVLYRLQKEGKVVKISDCPPLWKKCLSSPERGTATTSRAPVDTASTFEDRRVRTHCNSKSGDILASLVNEEFDKLCQSVQCSKCDHDDCGRRSFASFVLQNGDDFRVVAFGTGSCFVSTEQQMCSEALRSEDSRAEIVAHQSFKRYLCRELIHFHLKDAEPSNVLERCRNNPAMFKLKDGIIVRFYFFNYETTGERVTNRSLNLKESSLHIRMRCRIREKLAKWSIVGLQGALLSNYLAPVYLDSVTIDSPSSDEWNAFLTHWQLVANIGPSLNPLLPPYFNQNVPKLSMVNIKLPSSLERTNNGVRSCNHSSNWSLGDSSLEIIDGTSGRLCSGDGSSRLSHRSVFKEFLFLCQLTGRHDLFKLKTCSQCKSAATDYMLASSLLRTHLQEYCIPPLRDPHQGLLQPSSGPI